VTRCSICQNPQVEAINAAILSRRPDRAVAQEFSVSRSTLRRHRLHLPRRGGDQLAEALKLLERTSPERGREHLRALEAARAALDLELRDFRRARTATKSPSESQLRQLERNLEDAWAAYERAKDGGRETAFRSLQGVREAERAIRAATAARLDDPIDVVLTLADGTPLTTWEASQRDVLGSYGVPEEFWGPEYAVTVQAQLEGSPEIQVRDRRGGLVWQRRGSKVSRPRPGKVVRGPWKAEG
jgi:hypothetical protein